MTPRELVCNDWGVMRCLFPVKPKSVLPAMTTGLVPAHSIEFLLCFCSHWRECRSYFSVSCFWGRLVLAVAEAPLLVGGWVGWRSCRLLDLCECSVVVKWKEGEKKKKKELQKRKIKSRNSLPFYSLFFGSCSFSFSFGSLPFRHD